MKSCFIAWKLSSRRLQWIWTPQVIFWIIWNLLSNLCLKTDDEIKSDEKDEMVLYFADMDLAEEPNLKPKSTNKSERIPFRGDRYLTDESKVFDHNAWWVSKSIEHI